MTTRVLKSSDDIEKLARFLAVRSKYPLTVTVTQGDNRTRQQNRLAQRWFTDISRQLGDQTHEDVRAYCKMTIGVPILRAQNEAFCGSYDATIGPLPFEERLAAIKALDIPVTRLMTVRQMVEFMDEMSRYWTEQGMRLTDPDALKYEEEFA